MGLPLDHWELSLFYKVGEPTMLWCLAYSNWDAHKPFVQWFSRNGWCKPFATHREVCCCFTAKKGSTNLDHQCKKPCLHPILSKHVANSSHILRIPRFFCFFWLASPAFSATITIDHPVLRVQDALRAIEIFQGYDRWTEECDKVCEVGCHDHGQLSWIYCYNIYIYFTYILHIYYIYSNFYTYIM